MPTNIDTVKTIYENFQRGDVPAILARLHEDVEWEHDTVNHGIPWIVPRRGRANVIGFFESLATLDIKQFEPRHFLSDDRHVAVICVLEAVVKSTGRTIKELETHVWTFDDEGMVTKFRHAIDTHQAWLAVHGTPASAVATA
jgi:uncharacterized protein